VVNFLKAHLNITFAIQLHQLLRFASLMVISIVLSKSGVGLSEIGQIETLLYIGAALSVFWINGLIQGLLSYYPTLKEDEKNVFLVKIYFIFLFFSTLIFSILYLFQEKISIFFNATTLSYLPLFGAYLLVHLPTTLLEYFYLLKEKTNAIFTSSILTFLANGIFGIGLYCFHWGIREIIFSWIFIALIRHIFLIFACSGDFSRRSQRLKSPLQPYLSFCIPLILYQFIGQYAVNFDAWLVNFHYKGDASQFAIFRYGSRELPLVMSFAMGLSNSMTVRIAAEGDAAFAVLKAKTLRLMHVLFPFSIALLASSQWWFPMVFNANFQASVLLFDIFILLIISRLLFPQSIVLAKKESKTILIISIIELSINTILSFILIQKYGLAGVCFATFFAFLMEKIGLAFWLWKKHGILFSAYTPVRFWLLYSGAIVGVFCLKYFGIIYFHEIQL
jgi:O-antigen/teichoic acid export membrane protein